MGIILTCEHARNTVPPWLTSVFRGQKALLDSHRGYDIGALEIYEGLCKRLQPYYAEAGKFTRLAIELNRSLHHRALFSSLTHSLPKTERQRLIEEIWQPFRTRVENAIADWFAENPKGHLIHLSVHSFTPVFNGYKRNADIGLLYDPSRFKEKKLADRWINSLRRASPLLKIRRNYPYKGTSDGHTTALRRKFGERYIGIELEFNQGYFSRL
jgi:predicted N-formylglutamate amidohydrolase